MLSLVVPILGGHDVRVSRFSYNLRMRAIDLYNLYREEIARQLNGA